VHAAREDKPAWPEKASRFRPVTLIDRARAPDPLSMHRTLPRLIAVLAAALLALAPAAPAKSPAAGKGAAKACKAAKQARAACARKAKKAKARSAARRCRAERRQNRRAFARRWGAGGRAVKRCVAAAIRSAGAKPKPAADAPAAEDEVLEDELAEEELIDEGELPVSDEDFDEETAVEDEPEAEPAGELEPERR
jgi:hypothetical protein